MCHVTVSSYLYYQYCKIYVLTIFYVIQELEQEVEELQEDANDMTEDNHYNASSLTEATLSLRSLYKQTQTKMNERQQLLESSGNFFARSMEVNSFMLE